MLPWWEIFLPVVTLPPDVRSYDCPGGPNCPGGSAGENIVQAEIARAQRETLYKIGLVILAAGVIYLASK